METPKYNYGEIPEEVIRERLAAVKSSDMAELDDMEWLIYVTSNDLLTVLDALKFVADHGGTYEQHLRTPAWQLRVDILAALGIDES